MAGRGGTSARRYAQALFSLGLEKQQLGQWLRDLESIATVATVPDVRVFLEQARIPQSQKEAVLQEALGDVTEEGRRLLLLLAEQRATDRAPAILAAFRTQMDRHYHRVRAEIISAVPLSEADNKHLVSLLSRLEDGREVVVETREDPRIIGGLVLRLGDRLLDGSVRTRLRDMRTSLAARVLRSGSS